MTHPEDQASSVAHGDAAYFQHGMSLRDWFAGQLNLGNVVEFRSLKDAAEFLGEECPPSDDKEAITLMAVKVEAKIRYMFADAMLEHSKGNDQ